MKNESYQKLPCWVHVHHVSTQCMYMHTTSEVKHQKLLCMFLQMPLDYLRYIITWPHILRLYGITSQEWSGVSSTTCTMPFPHYTLITQHTHTHTCTWIPGRQDQWHFSRTEFAFHLSSSPIQHLWPVKWIEINTLRPIVNTLLVVLLYTLTCLDYTCSTLQIVVLQ